MPQSITTYIRTQGAIAAVINAAVNPALAWLGNRAMHRVPLVGDGSLLIDIALTTVILSLLVAVFIGAGYRRDLKAGRVAAPNGQGSKRRLLACLPGRAWALGLTLGAVIAALAVPALFVVLRLAGVSDLSFPAFALCKAAYTAALAYAVARWAIMRLDSAAIV